MSNKQSTLEQRLLREKALYRYANALERGDADTLAAILYKAESDAILEQQITEMHEVYLEEKHMEMVAHDTERVQQMLRQHIPSGFEPMIEDIAIPSLTVGDVVARLQSDAAVRGPVKQELITVVQQLRQNITPLPQSLSIRGVQTLFTQIGVSVSDHFQKLFRETAIFLSMGREQGIAQLAATRHQQQQAKQQREEQQVSEKEKQPEYDEEEQ